MTTSSNSIAFSEYLAIPFFGETGISRENTQRYWLPFFNREVRRTDIVYNQHGELDGGTGDITGFTFRAGRWQVILDRPRVETTGTSNDPLAWNQTAWLVIAAPLVALAGISACIFGGLLKHYVARPLGWLPAPRELSPEK